VVIHGDRPHTIVQIDPTSLTPDASRSAPP
jgi:hypothetical protein